MTSTGPALPTNDPPLPIEPYSSVVERTREIEWKLITSPTNRSWKGKETSTGKQIEKTVSPRPKEPENTSPENAFKVIGRASVDKSSDCSQKKRPTTQQLRQLPIEKPKDFAMRRQQQQQPYRAPFDMLERTRNVVMTNEQLEKHSTLAARQAAVANSRLRTDTRFKPNFDQFLSATPKMMNDVLIPTPLQRIREKALASKDLDEEALYNALLTAKKRSKLITQGEHEILIGSLRNRHDREAIQQIARVKTMLRLVDELTDDL